MGFEEIIALISLALVYGGAIIGFWIKIRVKLTELDMKIENNKNEFDSFRLRSIEERDRIDDKIDSLLEENKQEHKEISIKQDLLLKTLNDFKIEILKK